MPRLCSAANTSIGGGFSELGCVEAGYAEASHPKLDCCSECEVDGVAGFEGDDDSCYVLGYQPGHLTADRIAVIVVGNTYADVQDVWDLPHR